MTHLKSLCVAMAIAGLAGCATESTSVKLSTDAPHETRVDSREVELLDLRLKVGDLENQVEVKNQQLAELTEMLVAAELARTDHLVADSDRR